MCCGPKREAMKMQRAGSVAGSTMGSAAASAVGLLEWAPQRARLAVVYRGRGVFLVTGALSREVYQFSALEPEQAVDARDVDALVGSGFFLAKA